MQPLSHAIFGPPETREDGRPRVPRRDDLEPRRRFRRPAPRGECAAPGAFPRDRTGEANPHGNPVNAAFPYAPSGRMVRETDAGRRRYAAGTTRPARPCTRQPPAIDRSGAPRLPPAGLGLVRGPLRLPHRAAGGRLAGDPGRQGRPGLGAHRLGQDLRGLPLRPRLALPRGARGRASRRDPHPLRLAAQGALERHREEPARAARRAARGRAGGRASPPGHPRRGAHRRHPLLAPPGHAAAAAPRPRHHARVALPAAHEREGATLARDGPQGDRRRDPRGGPRQAGQPPRPSRWSGSRRSARDVPSASASRPRSARSRRWPDSWWAPDGSGAARPSAPSSRWGEVASSTWGWRSPGTSSPRWPRRSSGPRPTTGSPSSPARTGPRSSSSTPGSSPSGPPTPSPSGWARARWPRTTAASRGRAGSTPRSGSRRGRSRPSSPPPRSSWASTSARSTWWPSWAARGRSTWRCSAPAAPATGGARPREPASSP